MENSDLGYNLFFEEKRNALGLGDLSVARVTSEVRQAYRVKNSHGEYLGKITGKQMFNASSREDYPAVGDWVLITELDKELAVIHKVLPRQTIIKRKFGDKNRVGEKSDFQVIAANIDFALVVESIDRDYNLNRFERYLAIAEDGGVKPVIVLNKIDLISEEELNLKLVELKDRFPGVKVILASTVKENGLDDLKKYITKEKTYCFLGSSGVGKSSLINRLLEEDSIKTGDISSYSWRGKHTTTTRQMYFLKNGGIVIDNPGIREVGMTDVDKGINALFDEITFLARKCRYTNCSHTKEPGCEVLKAVESKTLSEEKYLNFINLRKETAYYNLNKKEKLEKDRQFGKFIKKAKKDLREVNKGEEG